MDTVDVASAADAASTLALQATGPVRVIGSRSATPHRRRVGLAGRVRLAAGAAFGGLSARLHRNDAVLAAVVLHDDDLG